LRMYADGWWPSAYNRFPVVRADGFCFSSQRISISSQYACVYTLLYTETRLQVDIHNILTSN
jgi:hypothetical protein